MAVPRRKKGRTEKIGPILLKANLIRFKTIKKLVLPLEEGVCCTKHSIDDVKVPTSKAGHHLFKQVRPFLREIFPSYDTDGITQLWK